MTKIFAIAGALLTLGLGACSRSADDPAPPAARNEAPPAPIADAPEPTAPPAATPDANAAGQVPAAVPPAPDEQMMDDASAAGMTARASREDASANEAVPVEQVERK